MDKEDVVYTYTMEYYAAIKNEILPFAMTCMQLQGIMLSEISQSEKDNYYDVIHMWNLRNKTKDHGRTEGKIKQDEIREGDKP